MLRLFQLVQAGTRMKKQVEAWGLIAGTLLSPQILGHVSP